MLIKKEYFFTFLNDQQRNFNINVLSGKSASFFTGKNDGRILFKIAGKINRISVVPILDG